MRPVVRAPWVIALLIAAAACNPGGSGNAPATTVAQASAAPDDGPAPLAQPATPSEPVELPDLSQGLAHGLCGKGPGNEGADAYFVGDFTVSGSIVTGTEKWILFANEKWITRGGNDCDITWNMKGRTGKPGSCADCDISLVMTGFPQVDASKCPEGLIKKEAKQGEMKYDIMRAPDGTAHFYFHDSGKRLGQGYHGGDRVTYVSEHKCVWF